MCNEKGSTDGIEAERPPHFICRHTDGVLSWHGSFRSAIIVRRYRCIKIQYYLPTGNQ